MRGHAFFDVSVQACQDYISRCSHQIWNIWIIEYHSPAGMIWTQDQAVFIFFRGKTWLSMLLVLKESKSQGCTYKILWSAAAGLKIQIDQVANVSELASHTCFWLRGWVRSHQLKWKIKEIANGPHSAPPPTIPSLFDTLKLAYGAH